MCRGVLFSVPTISATHCTIIRHPPARCLGHFGQICRFLFLRETVSTAQKLSFRTGQMDVSS
ncbi:hypothetical protein BO71DRAFT_401466 [Aspergillus ellipticus CBS 707.79]|uniref:Uncharacterized protein n=1 Tax=Aspergillus ellipticus CBS 707.79 TaxID=1448320 RepID=A0A319DAA4_9EURO|nr:hypothetical protein BO71DRAFT_401466 [Aspergillus ellipticus CBS 707.79]